MRILVAGEWVWPWYEQACADALTKLGHEVRRFSWIERFRNFASGKVEPIYISKFAELQNRAIWGPKVFALNIDLLKSVKEFRPHFVFAYRATHIFPSTLRKIKRFSPEIALIQYCNDDPFSPKANKVHWRHLQRSIPLYDIHFVYRYHNVENFKQHGAKLVELLRSYFVTERNFPVVINEEDHRFLCDIVFAGHYEGDWRIDCLEAVLMNGFKLNLFGGGWDKAKGALSPHSPIHGLYPIVPVVDEEYRKALSGAKIALSFLSKLNRDTYTRRNFEIPATGAFMLSEYSDDLATLFVEGKEAEFFRSKQEMLDKIKYYLSHDFERQDIARRGRERVMNEGHDVVARMKQMINTIEKFRTAQQKRLI